MSSLASFVSPRVFLFFFVLPGPQHVRVGVPRQRRVSALREALVRSQRARRAERRFVRAHGRHPVLGVVAVTEIREPRPAPRVVHRLGLAPALVRFVPLNQEVPLVVHRADERVVQPREAVQKAPRALIRLRHRERGVRGDHGFAFVHLKKLLRVGERGAGAKRGQ